MAYKTESFNHPKTLEIREVPYGFSWTTLFFGVFVPLYRGDYKWALIMILAGLLTSGLSWFVFPFFYNKSFLKDTIKRGFVETKHESYYVKHQPAL